MNILIHISDFIIPLIIFTVVLIAMLSSVNAYETFIKGATDGLKTVVSILPTLLGLMLAVGILRGSGVLDLIALWLNKIVPDTILPGSVLPLFIVKMFSSSAATGLLLDIFKEYGTESYPGLIAALTLSSTETIFYTMSVYFIAAGVKKTRWTLPGALIATLAGTIASVFLASLLIKG